VTISLRTKSEELSREIQAIDELVDRINRFKVDPQFSQTTKERQDKIPDFNSSDQFVLHRLIDLIAYSNNANADKVGRLLERRPFQEIFQGYSIDKTADLSAENILQAYWPRIKDIRFKYKVSAMIGCAKCLVKIRTRYGSFMGYLRTVGLPAAIKSELDIEKFWECFSQIRTYFRELEFPYFKHFTSLCHLLMDLGFDCAKPDLAVIKAAVELGIVSPAPKQRKNPEKSRAHSEDSLKRIIETIQTYALCRNTRAPVIDLYFLIDGGQSGVKKLVQGAYYSQDKVD